MVEHIEEGIGLLADSEAFQGVLRKLGFYDPKLFINSYYLKNFFYSEYCSPLSVELSEFFNIVEAAHRSQDNRYVTRENQLLGENYSDFAKQCGGEVSSLNIGREFINGRSYVIQNFEKYYNPIKELTDSSAETLSLRVGATAFATPKGRQTLDAHYDTNDVIVIQLSGVKNWKIYEPLVPHADNALPVIKITDDLRRELKAQNPIEMKAGDILYIPRGWVHEAESSQDTHSIHVSIVLFYDSFSSVLSNISKYVIEKLKENVKYRLPLNSKLLEHDLFKKITSDYLEEFNQIYNNTSYQKSSMFRENIFSTEDHLSKAARARASIELLLDRDDLKDTYLAASGANFTMRNYCYSYGYELSTDGDRFVRISRVVWEYLSGRERISFLEIDSCNFIDRRSMIDNIYLLVHELGIYEIQMSDSN